MYSQISSRKAVEVSEAETLPRRADALLRDLLQPDHRQLLEQFRFSGSDNHVYRIPMGDHTKKALFVKLPPGRWVTYRSAARTFLRNLMYGEREMVVMRHRVEMEIERAREWQAAGLPIAPLVETTIPGVRVFEALSYPTFYTILTDKASSKERKMSALAIASRALYEQHKTAWGKGKTSLVHRFPGPWHIMLDLDRGGVYWFDLEHPADAAGASLEMEMARGVRIFLYGVLDHLSDCFDEVIDIFVRQYRLELVLRRVIEDLRRSQRAPLNRLVQRMGRGKKTTALREQVPVLLQAALEHNGG